VIESVDDWILFFARIICLLIIEVFSEVVEF